MKKNLNDFPYEYGKAVSNPTAKEGNRSFSLDNQSQFKIKMWAIDSVVFKDSVEQRCDFLIEAFGTENFSYYWVELKGKDVVKACRQIINTIDLVNVLDYARQEARIITSGTNKIAIRTLEYLRLDKQMRRKGGCLKTYTDQGVEKI